jgi:hypothetical protein
MRLEVELEVRHLGCDPGGQSETQGGPVRQFVGLAELEAFADLEGDGIDDAQAAEAATLE